MPTIDEFFPSNYLRATDLGGKEHDVTIDRVESDVFENDGRKQKKPIVFFRDNAKPLVVNKTNFQLIAKACGEDSKDWPGKSICIYPVMVSFRGKVQEAIRVKRVTALAPKPIDAVAF